MNEESNIFKALNEIKEKAGVAAPYSLPAGYFEELNSKLLNRIANESSDQDSDDLLIDSAAKMTTYQVPPGYFDSLETGLLQKANAPHQSAKIISIKKWLRIAAAAIIIGFVAYFSIQQFQGNSNLTTNEKRTAAAIMDVNSVELTSFVGDAGENALSANDQKNTTDTNQLFEDISNDELRSFLNENNNNDSEMF